MATAAKALLQPILLTRDAHWSQVLAPDVGLLIDGRTPCVSDETVELALQQLQGPVSVSGSPGEIGAGLGGLPAELTADIVQLAERFAALMAVPNVRLRLERIETDACRKWHLDYTDLRLVVTYRGPGTQFRLSEAGAIEQIAEQQVALFKGRDFGAQHAMISHRSPPIAGTGIVRLVLVIDTPLRPRDAAFHEQRDPETKALMPDGAEQYPA